MSPNTAIGILFKFFKDREKSHRKHSTGYCAISWLVSENAAATGKIFLQLVIDNTKM